MIKVKVLRPVFVDAIPENVEQGNLYISMEFATAVHKCCCGCEREVVTPFSPTDWKLMFDGVSVSLSPSIGNWSFPCRSHYWIRNNRIEWAGDMSQRQIEGGRAHDRLSKQRQFGEAKISTKPEHPTPAKGFWARLLDWFK
jgi:hypothetical protein